jgi:hypothetical protein
MEATLEFSALAAVAEQQVLVETEAELLQVQAEQHHLLIPLGHQQHQQEYQGLMQVVAVEQLIMQAQAAQVVAAVAVAEPLVVAGKVLQEL